MEKVTHRGEPGEEVETTDQATGDRVHVKFDADGTHTSTKPAHHRVLDALGYRRAKAKGE